MGEISDGIINGDFDSITGEYLGEGEGFPRTMQRDCGVHNYIGKKKKKGKKNPQNPIYSQIRQLLKANKQAEGCCKNRNGTLTFLTKFYISIGVEIKYGSWNTHKEVVNTLKPQFKEFIKNYSTEIK